MEVFPDLVLNDDILNVLRKSAHGMHVLVVFVVPSRIGALRYGLQLIFDPFECPETELGRAVARNPSMMHTQIVFAVA